VPFLGFIYRDYIPAKAPGPVAGWLRQVTCSRGRLAPSLKQPIGLFINARPPFIAGPLAQIFTANASILNKNQLLFKHIVQLKYIK